MGLLLWKKLKSLIGKPNRKGSDGEFIRPYRLSNVVSTEDDVFQVGGGGCVKFYPEDEERMRGMSVKEKKEFKKELLLSKRYMCDTTERMVSDAEKNMEGLIRETLMKFYQRVHDEIPDTGDFEAVKEFFDISAEGRVKMKGFMKVYQPPKGVDGREWMRALDIVAYKEGSQYVCSKMLKCGSKQEIIDLLKDESMITTVLRTIPELIDGLSDIR